MTPFFRTLRLFTLGLLMSLFSTSLFATQPLEYARQNVAVWGNYTYGIIVASVMSLIAIYSALFIILYKRGDYRAPKRFRMFFIGLGILLIFGYIVTYFLPNPAADVPLDPINVNPSGTANDNNLFIYDEVSPSISFTQPAPPVLGDYSSYQPPSYTLASGFLRLDEARIERLFEHYVETLDYLTDRHTYLIGDGAAIDYTGTAIASTYTRRMLSREEQYDALNTARAEVETRSSFTILAQDVVRLMESHFYANDIEPTWEDVHNQVLIRLNEQFIDLTGMEIPNENNYSSLGAPKGYYESLYYFGSTWDRPKIRFGLVWGYENDYFQDVWDEGNYYSVNQEDAGDGF